MIKEINIHCHQKSQKGFTIPYLYKIEKDLNRKKTITEIIAYLSNSEENYIITKCNKLDDFIIGLHKKEYPPLSYYRSFKKLYYNQNQLGHFDTLKDLAFFLTVLYQRNVDNGEFSKNRKTLKWE
jgi:hypothetical protein